MNCLSACVLVGLAWGQAERVPAPLPLGQFPPTPFVDEQLRASDAYWHWLALRAGAISWQAEDFKEQQKEVTVRRSLWHYLRVAQTTAYPSQQQGYLRELYHLLGPADFYAGRLPPVLPFVD